MLVVGSFWSFDFGLDTHTGFSLVVRSVCLQHFVVLSNWSIRFACVPVLDERGFYSGLQDGLFIWGMAHEGRI